MEHNNLPSNTQSNLTYNAPFVPNTPPNVGQQQEAQAQGNPVPPLESAPDLSAPVSPRGLQNYRTSHPLEEEPDTFNLPEYQPIKPGEPHMEKLADEAMNNKKVNIWLKNAQDNEELEDFQDAEESYEKALKYTENAEHYKLYAACLKNLSASSKNEAREKIYKEKASKAFYFLGELYAQQGAWKPAQAAYKTSCELACHTVPLQALVAASRQLGEKGDIVDALVKLADFYAGKGKIDLAIEKLEEALQVEQSFTILQKLEVLCGQNGGKDSQLKVNELAIRRFELQISEDPKNIGLYRDYAWFLESIGRQDEARAVIKRMDAMLQAVQYALFQTLQQTQQTLQKTFINKKEKDKAKIVDLRKTVHSQAEVIHHLQAKIQAQAEILANLSTKVETNTSKSSKDIDGLQKTFEVFEKEKLPAQAKKLELTITDFNQKISSQAGDITNLAAKIETNAAKSSKDIGDLQKTFGIFEKEKLPAQAKKLELTITDFNQKISSQAGGITNLAAKVETNAAKSSKDIGDLQKTFGIFEKEKLPAQATKLELTITDFNQKISSQAEILANLSTKLETNASKNSKEIDGLQKKAISLENEKLPAQAKSIQTLNTQLDSLGKQVQANAVKNDAAHTALQNRIASFDSLQLPEQINRLNNLNTQLETLKKQAQANATKTDAAIDALDKKVEFSKMTSLTFFHDVTHHNYYNHDADIIPLLINNPYLKSLCLRFNQALTNAVLSIIPNRFPNLEDLDLTHCKGMQLADLSIVVDKLPKLRRLMYFGLQGTPQQHNQIIQKLNARKIKHGGLN